MAEWKLYADGSSDDKTKDDPLVPGGWAYVLENGLGIMKAGSASQLCEGALHMETLALERGLDAIERPQDVELEIYVDFAVRAFLQKMCAGEEIPLRGTETERQLWEKIQAHIASLRRVSVATRVRLGQTLHQNCHEHANDARRELRRLLKRQKKEWR